jgi:hypothetical protein
MAVLSQVQNRAAGCVRIGHVEDDDLLGVRATGPGELVYRVGAHVVHVRQPLGERRRRGDHQ